MHERSLFGSDGAKAVAWLASYGMGHEGSLHVKIKDRWKMLAPMLTYKPNKRVRH